MGWAALTDPNQISPGHLRGLGPQDAVQYGEKELYSRHTLCMTKIYAIIISAKFSTRRQSDRSPDPPSFSRRARAVLVLFRRHLRGLYMPAGKYGPLHRTGLFRIASTEAEQRWCVDVLHVAASISCYLWRTEVSKTYEAIEDDNRC